MNYSGMTSTLGLSLASTDQPSRSSALSRLDGRILTHSDTGECLWQPAGRDSQRLGVESDPDRFGQFSGR
jgi:hypothetical protein